jgi:isopenicillin-N N-acyltransferase-like protein
MSGFLLARLTQPISPEATDIIEVNGKPHDRGYTYGTACRQQIQQTIDAHFLHYARHCHFSKATTLRLARKYLPHIRSYAPEFEEEIAGIAEGAYRPRDEIVMLAVYWELMYRYVTGSPHHCTAVAATGLATVNGETFVAQNNDEALEPWGTGFSRIVHSTPSSGPSFLAYTYPGFPGQMGLNSSGIALCVNALICDQHELGVPFQAITREVLEQRTIGDAVNAVMRAKKRASSGNLLIGDENGEIYDVETTPRRFECFYSSEQMVHTNHFLSTRLGVKTDIILESMCDTMIRYNRMNRILREQEGRISVETLTHAFEDHVNYPNSICRHVDERDAEKDRLKTADCMIFSPTKKVMWLARGNPCEAEFRTINLS